MKLLELFNRLRRRWSNKLSKYRSSAHRSSRIQQYLSSDRKPWSPGYSQYKADYIFDILTSDSLMECFRRNQPLPDFFGFRLDERVIEYPWVLSRLKESTAFLLDAGSTLVKYRYLAGFPMLKGRKIVVYTLTPTGAIGKTNVSYVYGDLRSTILRDETFDDIVCISTLEHIGMNNTRLYSRDPLYKENNIFDYQQVLREFRRVLMPGGRLLLTVPYGQRQNLGWLQQFDQEMLNDAISTFGGHVIASTFYRYAPNGWYLADAEDCVHCEYFDIHQAKGYDPDFAAAARAVACIEMIKE